MNGFSKRLKELMELESLSNRALSFKINVDRASIRLWLSGRFYPRYESLIKLATYFNITIDSLIGLDETEKDVEELTVVKSAFCEDAQGYFFNTITEYMKEHHLTKYAFAKRLEVDQKAFTNWLVKGSMPETSTIIRLSRMMNVSIDGLLGREV